MSGHIPALDGLRGIAILIVMIYHFFMFSKYQPIHWWGRAASDIAGFGWIGVDLFFVLSGFLITGILIDTRRKPHYYRDFLMRRVLRIFPLYYGVLVAFFLVLPALFSSEYVRHITRHSPWFWLYSSNVLTAWSGWSEVPLFLQHFWSLAVEEQFYLIWPPLIFFFSRRAMMYACGVMVAISIGFRIWMHAAGYATAAYVLMPARMDALATGALLAYAVRDPRACRFVLRFAKPIFIAAALAVSVVFAFQTEEHTTDPLMGTIGYSLLALTFGAFLVLGVASASGSRLNRVLTSPSLRFLGKYSYGLYVFHQPIAIMLPMIGITARIIPPLAGVALYGQLAYSAIASVLTVAAALTSWYFLEKHFLNLKQRFSYGAPVAVSADAGR